MGGAWQFHAPCVCVATGSQNWGLGLGCRVMGLGVGAIHARSSGENRQMAFRPYLEVKGKRASVKNKVALTQL